MSKKVIIKNYRMVYHNKMKILGGYDQIHGTNMISAIKNFIQLKYPEIHALKTKIKRGDGDRYSSHVFCIQEGFYVGDVFYSRSNKYWYHIVFEE